MSLSLIQGDSSVEEEEAAATDEEEEEEDYQKLSEEEGHSSSRLKISYKAPSNGSSSSILPSAMYAFSQVGYLLKFLFWIISRQRGLGFFFSFFFLEISGPPQFLSHFVGEYGVGADYNPHQQRKHQKIWRNNNNQ
jgi:hypothetical protein